MRSAISVLLVAIAAGELPAEIPEADFRAGMAQIGESQDSGEFREADALVEAFLGQGPTVAQRRLLEFERERSRRIQRDYRVTREDLFVSLDRRLVDLTREEFERWIDEGRFDRLMVNGEERFVNPSARNLLFRHAAELYPRRRTPPSYEWERFLLRHLAEAREEAAREATVTADPHHFRLTMTITVEPGAVAEGEVIRCWMPYPQQFASQSGVELLEASPEPVYINAPGYPMRSIYFEQPSAGDGPTEFRAVYTVSVHPRVVEIDEERVAAADQRANPDFDYFTREAPPHVVYTPEIRALAGEIVGDEANPARRARLIYDWMAENLDYSFAREYSTLRNIPMYVLDNGYGDCGQLALLYITLCRAVDVPARWQSGWVIYPQWANLHDWAEVWLAPYGWVPVDANYAMDGANLGFGLTAEEKEAWHEAFFGGLDAYRLTINREHGYPHYPPKEDFRSDTVDFQRGELEANGRNLYYDTFNYDLEVEFLTPSDAALHAGLRGE